MALYRQSSSGANGNATSDYVSVGIHGGSRHIPYRRSKPPQANRISVGLFALTLSLIISIPALCYQILQSKGVETSRDQAQDDDVSTDPDLYKNVTRTKESKHLDFGNESFARDRVRRDENEALRQARDGSVENIRAIMKNLNRKSLFNKTRSFFNKRGNGLHKEAGHKDLIMFEAKYKASLQNVRGSKDVVDDADDRNREVPADADEYDDGMDSRADVVEEVDDAVLEGRERAASTVPHDIDTWDSSHVDHVEDEKQDAVEEADNDASDVYSEETPRDPQNSSVVHNSKRARSVEAQPTRRFVPDKRRPVAKKKPKNQKPLGAACPMTILNSTALVVEPQENRKFASFMLEYAEKEQPLMGQENWEPRFGGHQTIREREESFLARDHEMKCGFVNGPDVLPGTGFNLDEDDRKYLSSCHIAVSSCIFGNSDRLRSPMGKTVSRLSKKNVCFVMFVDEASLKTLSAEGHMPDTMGFIGLWKIVVVKDLPYTDMRRVGKIPKLLPHRIFPSARYSIWLDSKLRLTLDPLLILEYFLWRKGYEYAISNHYDRHCLWEEVAQNKRLNKYDHSIIDEQFRFYQSDGMRRFNEADPNKLLPSNVPEGSFIVRAHTPMSNLFSCLWFNEVDHFTPRDQLSFAYTYHKLMKMNPGKRFYLHMFKDCERRKIAKLYRHRSEEKKSNSHIDL